MLKTILVLLLCTFAMSVRQMAASDRGIKISHDNMLGDYLTDKDGMSIYVYDQDDNNMSACYSNCTSLWKVFEVDAGITVYGNMTTSMLGKFMRDDGRAQLTFNQMPLYFYKKDMMSGDMNGQGILSHRGYWYLVAPDGTPILNMNNSTIPLIPSMSSDSTNQPDDLDRMPSMDYDSY
jgi:predicted lipoprotein with Yx(FWY)xxD motif